MHQRALGMWPKHQTLHSGAGNFNWGTLTDCALEHLLSWATLLGWVYGPEHQKLEVGAGKFNWGTLTDRVSEFIKDQTNKYSLREGLARPCGLSEVPHYEPKSARRCREVQLGDLDGLRSRARRG